MTQQEVIKRFMYSLKTTDKTRKDAVSEAVYYAASNKFTNLDNLKNQFLSDIEKTNNAEIFLKKYCGINLNNADTGAITGSDAGSGTVKTASSVVLESGNVSDWDYVAPGSSFTLSSGLKVNLPSDYTVYGHVYHSYADSSKNYWEETKESHSLGENELFILKCLPHWLEASESLIRESYGFTFDGSNCETYEVTFGYDKGVKNNDTSFGGWLARTPNDNYIEGKASKVGIEINLYYYSNLARDNADGKDTIRFQGELDRTIVHEGVHGIMAANDKYASLLSAYITEGLAELVHGVDDTRPAIISLASDANLMQQAIVETKHWADYPTVISGNVTLNAPCYAGGYTLLRYMAKQAATSFKGTDENDSFWIHNDFITIVSGLGNDTIESEGDKNSLTSGAGDDSIIISGANSSINAGTGINLISLTSASQNSLILYGGGSDSIYGTKSTDTLSLSGVTGLHRNNAQRKFDFEYRQRLVDYVNRISSEYCQREH